MSRINRNYPGPLASARGDTFLTTLNNDRRRLYGHSEDLQGQNERLVGYMFPDGTRADNTAPITLSGGQVVVAAGYKAIIGVPVETATELRQAYIPDAPNWVMLGLTTAGNLRLRVLDVNEPGSSEILIAYVDPGGNLNVDPVGKPYARMTCGTDLGWAGVFDARRVRVENTGSANTDFEIHHGLKRIPTGYLVIRLSKAGIVYDGETAWTTTAMYLKCSAANAAVTLMVW